jgi:hypothetical protein
MPPDAEATFIALWQQGLTTAAIAQRDMSPSQFIQEYQWKALTDCRSFTPERPDTGERARVRGLIQWLAEDIS